MWAQSIIGATQKRRDGSGPVFAGVAERLVRFSEGALVIIKYSILTVLRIPNAWREWLVSSANSIRKTLSSGYWRRIEPWVLAAGHVTPPARECKKSLLIYVCGAVATWLVVARRYSTFNNCGGLPMLLWNERKRQ